MPHADMHILFALISVMKNENLVSMVAQLGEELSHIFSSHNCTYMNREATPKCADLTIPHKLASTKTKLKIK